MDWCLWGWATSVLLGKNQLTFREEPVNTTSIMKNTQKIGGSSKLYLDNDLIKRRQGFFPMRGFGNFKKTVRNSINLSPHKSKKISIVWPKYMQSSNCCKPFLEDLLMIKTAE